MREIVIQINGDDWNDESEADELCEDVVNALDKADFDYIDVTIKD